MIANYNNTRAERINDFYDCLIQENPMDGFEREEYSKELKIPKEDRFDMISELLPELVRIIFFLGKTDLPEIALVSRNWKEMAYDKELYKMLYSTIEPSRLINEEVWKKYIGTPEKETLLPLCIFKTVENSKGKGFLTWVTETVEIADEDGTVRTMPINPESIGELVKAPKEGHPTGYDLQAWSAAIKEPRTPERSHWVWMEEKKIGRGKTYLEQQSLAKERGGNISGLNDTIVQTFMEKVRSGKSCFDNGSLKNEYTFIRVSEMTNTFRTCLGFGDDLLNVIQHYSCDDASALVMVFVARKSFGR